MTYSRIAMTAFAAVLAGTGMARAEPLLQINPGVMQTIVQSVQNNNDHSAVVPINPPGGGSGGSGTPDLSSTKKDLPTPGGGTPGGGSPGSPNSGGQPLGSVVMEHRDYALVCKITESGALRFANSGSETMPSGIRIKWKAGSQRGAFRLNVDLEPGASASAPDMFEDDSARSCWATATM